MKTCVVCGGPLSGAQKKLCSKRCKSKWLMQSEAWQRAKRKSEAKPEAKARKAAREEARKVQRTCDMCGRAWRVKASRPSLYCSHLCGRLANLPPRVCAIPPGHPALPSQPPALPRGRTSMRQHQADGRRLVSEARLFVAGECRFCGAAFVASRGRGAWPLFCSTICSRKDAKATRRARLRMVDREPIFRNRVFERDGWRCYMCRKRLNREAVAPFHPLAPTLDHVIPLARGGSHTMANLRAACFSCNAKKNMHGGGEQLALVG